MGKRDKVWLGVAGIVSYKGKWLVVKKNYGGLKGKWSFPAGFVEEGETIDEAIKREILEETGIVAEETGIIAIRSGVLSDVVSDNMIIFALEAMNDEIIVDKRELMDAAFLTQDELMNDPDSTLLVHHFMKTPPNLFIQNMNPGNHFGYTKYKIFDLR
jgi:8-oxo-dGTP diphosphatase